MPLRACVPACVFLAALSLLLASLPHFDPFAWATWGREITRPDVGLSTVDGPSWKPLPVLFTTPFSLLGDATPAAWLVMARAGGLMAFLLAYRLGARLGSRLAGGVAAATLILIPGWFQELALGGELGPLVALVLGAIDRHLAKRPTQALVLGFAAALLRTETWPFLVMYAIWAWRDRAVDRRLVAGVLFLVPALWFAPDWVTLGDPFHGAEVARASTEAKTAAFLANPTLEVVRRAYGLVPLPLLLLALAAAALGIPRREWTLVVLGAGALGWVALVAAMAVVGGYTGLSRFMVPTAAVACVLGGVGVSKVADLVGRPGRMVVVALVLGALLVFSVEPAAGLRDQTDRARAWQRSAIALQAVVRQAGGAHFVACRRPVIRHPGLTQLAWILGLPIAEIRTHVDGDSLVFAPVGNPPPTSVDLPRRLLARNDDWEVYEVGAPRSEDGCPRRIR